MSQRIKFSTSSYFEQTGPNSFDLLVRQSVWKSIFAVVFLCVFMLSPFITGPTENQSIFLLLWVVPSGIFLIVSIFNIFYSERIQFYINENKLEKTKCIAGIAYKKQTVTWQKDSYYLNENVYDSYQNITRVWLLAKSEAAKQSKQLIVFSSTKQYQNLIQLLREKFPSMQIREWHD